MKCNDIHDVRSYDTSKSDFLSQTSSASSWRICLDIHEDGIDDVDGVNNDMIVIAGLFADLHDFCF